MEETVPPLRTIDGIGSGPGGTCFDEDERPPGQESRRDSQAVGGDGRKSPEACRVIGPRARHLTPEICDVRFHGRRNLETFDSP